MLGMYRGAFLNRPVDAQTDRDDGSHSSIDPFAVAAERISDLE